MHLYSCLVETEGERFKMYTMATDREAAKLAFVSHIAELQGEEDQSYEICDATRLELEHVGEVAHCWAQDTYIP